MDIYAKRVENKTMAKGSDTIDHSGESTFEKTTSDFKAHGPDAFAKRAENKHAVMGSAAIDQSGKGTFEKTSDEVGAAEKLREATIMMARRHSQINVDAKKGTVEEQLFRSVDQILNHMRSGIKARCRSDNDMRRNMEQIFRRFDSNKNGKITYESFQKTVNQFFGINLSPKQAQMVFKVLDIDGDGVVDRQEFVKAFLDEGHSKDKPEDLFSAHMHKHHESGAAREVREKRLVREERRERKNSMIEFDGLSTDALLRRIREKAQARASSDLLLARKLKHIFPEFNDKGGMTEDLFRTSIAKSFGIQMTLKQAKEIFKTIDTDKSGSLDRDELIEGLFGKEAMIKEYQQKDSHDVEMTKRSDNLANERKKHVVQLVEQTNQPKKNLTTKQILSEIKANIKRRAKTETDITRFMQQLFRRFDKASMGYITPDSFKQIVEDFFGINLNEEQQKNLFDEVDSDNSGTIEREELVIAFLGVKELPLEQGKGAGPEFSSHPGSPRKHKPRGRKVDTWKEEDQLKADALLAKRRKEKGSKQAAAEAAAKAVLAANDSGDSGVQLEVATKFGSGKLQASVSRPDGVTVVELERGGLGAIAYLQEGAEEPAAAAFAAMAATQPSNGNSRISPELSSTTTFSPGQAEVKKKKNATATSADGVRDNTLPAPSNRLVPMPPPLGNKPKKQRAPARMRTNVVPLQQDHRIMPPLPVLLGGMTLQSPATNLRATGGRSGRKSGRKSGKKLRSSSKKSEKKLANNFSPSIKKYGSPAGQKLESRLLDLARSNQAMKGGTIKLGALGSLKPESGEGTLSPQAIRTHLQNLKTAERLRFQPRPPPSNAGSVVSTGVRSGVEAASNWHSQAKGRRRMRELTRISDEIALAPPAYYKHHSPRSSKKAQSEFRLPRLPKATAK
jgi:Ca2+-binding EF-hand superfamily protein